MSHDTSDPTNLILVTAEMEAAWLGDTDTTGRHLALGVVTPTSWAKGLDPAGQIALARQGVTAKRLSSALMANPLPEPLDSAELAAYRAEAGNVLARARQMAADLGQTRIGTGHILLALIEDEISDTAFILRDLGVNLVQLCADTLSLIDTAPTALQEAS